MPIPIQRKYFDDSEWSKVDYSLYSTNVLKIHLIY